MDILKSIPYIIIAAMFVYIIFLREVDNCPECQECDTFDTSAFINSLPIQYPDTIYKPVHYEVKVIEEVPMEVPAVFDTMDVINKYFTGWTVIDTVINNDDAFIVVKDEMTKNHIIRRSITDMVFFPKYKIVTQTVYKPEPAVNKVFIGGGASATITGSFDLKANVLFLSKKDHAYQLYYGLISREIGVTLFFKLSFNNNRNKKKLHY